MNTICLIRMTMCLHGPAFTDSYTEINVGVELPEPPAVFSDVIRANIYMIESLQRTAFHTAVNS